MGGLLPTQDLSATGFDADGRDLVAALRASPKRMPPRYGYDAVGSHLYDEITRLKSYYPTRTEEALLRRCTPGLPALSVCEDVVELGSGAATKTRLILDPFHQLGRPVVYIPIDISRDMLQEASATLARRFPGLGILPVAGDYRSGLEWVRAKRMGPKLLVFLGSSLGNMSVEDARELLVAIARGARRGDALLLGVDLVKPREVLEAAYNDPPGSDVLSRFRLNRLGHINSLFEGDFDVANFSSRAVYNPRERAVEAHLISRRDHAATLRRLGTRVELAAGERIVVDYSRKFSERHLLEDLEGAGFEPIETWRSRATPYLLVLARRL